MTTIRHVGEHRESNPLARRWFARFGFTGGLVIVCLLFTVLAVGQFFLFWGSCGVVGGLWDGIGGLAIASIQWEVARFNENRRPSRVTILALRAYSTWARWWRR